MLIPFNKIKNKIKKMLTNKNKDCIMISQYNLTGNKL